MGNKFGKLCAFLLLAVLEFAILTVVYVIIEDYVRYQRNDDLIDRIVVLAVVIVAGIVIPVYVVCWNIYTGKASNWEYTHATLTGHKEMYQEYVFPGSNPRTARKYRQYKDIQIKYTVNNREYIKYVSDHEVNNRRHGRVRIKYLKKRPSYFRIVRGNTNL